jgi:spore germination cell wall hydrolase CwlJ-like protein
VFLLIYWSNQLKTILLAIIAIVFSASAVYGEFEKWQQGPIPDDQEDSIAELKTPGVYRVAVAGSRKPAKKQKTRKTQIVKTNQRVQFTKADEKCLAMNIFYEAGVEEKVGQIAVGHVTLNRLETGRWGDTICRVVYAKSQFSWTLFKDKRAVVPTGENWEVAKEVAKEVLNGSRVSTLHDSLYYHAEYVSPYWKKSVTKVSQIGTHIFYEKM